MSAWPFYARLPLCAACSFPKRIFTRFTPPSVLRSFSHSPEKFSKTWKILKAILTQELSPFHLSSEKTKPAFSPASCCYFRCFPFRFLSPLAGCPAVFCGRSFLLSPSFFSLVVFRKKNNTEPHKNGQNHPWSSDYFF